MNPTSAGIMAQVLAVLILATAFAPAIRGSMQERKIIASDGRMYREIRPEKAFATYRVAMTVVVMVIIILDVVILLAEIEADGFLARLGFVVMNSSATGFLLSMIALDMLKHVSNKGAEGGGENTTSGNQ